ncbi:universal stress protein [Microbacterium sp. gxy059]|uniref:universal stress protein n=1 Tax=Microbacterium sp. gxy059 TaxID=2957199 RepID=UPI003D995C7F
MSKEPRRIDVAPAELGLPPEDRSRLAGAVVVGAVPGAPGHVVQEAAALARTFGVPLLVVYVDVTRFIAGSEDAEKVLSYPIDIEVARGELDAVAEETARHLDDVEVDWAVRQVVGDPASALRKIAREADARMIVVGTRKRGVSEALREMFYGSVARRLSHRQETPVLVVPPPGA